MTVAAGSSCELLIGEKMPDTTIEAMPAFKACDVASCICCAFMGLTAVPSSNSWPPVLIPLQ